MILLVLVGADLELLKRLAIPSFTYSIAGKQCLWFTSAWYFDADGHRRRQMSDIVYSDKLVEITEDSILFRHYYFPFGSKTVNLDDVESVKTLEPTLRNGKWRIYGTGDFHTWFPLDKKRPDRDLIFVMTLKRRWWRV